MATSFPTSVQALTNVTDNVDYPEAATINYLNDTVEALEAKVGIDSSAVATSHDYILSKQTWMDGWVSSTAMTYVGAQSLSVTTDQTAIFTKGTKIKCTNDSTVKYFYVVSSTFSAVTTIVLAGEVDLTNAAITSPYYSYFDNPKGFKRGQDWYRARAYLSAEQENLVDEAYTKVTLDTEDYDSNSNFTGNTYTVPISGMYLIHANIRFNELVANTRYVGLIYKNGSDIAHNYSMTSDYAAFLTVNVSTTQALAKGDTIDMYVRSDSGGNTVDLTGDSRATFMEIQFIGI